MTDDFTIREQANKSAEKHNVTFHTEEYVNGYYLGYKAGFHECEKEHEWHDLRKDPNDLPRQGVELLVSVDGYTRTAMYSKETNSFTSQEGVIAWMYEPEFI